MSTQTKCGGAQGQAQSTLAAAIDAGLTETGEALGRGEISSEHAQIIAATMRQLPVEVDATARGAVERHVVSRAREVDPKQLRAIARRALEAAERTREQVDADEDRQLRDQEQSALARTRLTMRDNGDGTTTGRFTVPTLAGGILRKTIQQIASPRRDRAREGRGLACEGSEDGARTYAGTDWAHRYGLALLEVLEHLPTDRLGGKVAATVVATVDLDRLRGGVGAVSLDTGHVVSAGQARRLACNAGLVPVVLGGASLPLDLGRADRFFTEAQRVALATVYSECAAHGCDRPYAWSELPIRTPGPAVGGPICIWPCRCVGITIGGFMTRVSPARSRPTPPGSRPSACDNADASQPATPRVTGSQARAGVEVAVTRGGNARSPVCESASDEAARARVIPLCESALSGARETLDLIGGAGIGCQSGAEGSSS